MRRERGLEVHVGDGDLALGNVEDDLRFRISLDDPRDGLDILLTHHHARHAKRGGVAKEDLREALGDHGAEPIAVERLRGVLARAAATKVRAGEQNARTGEARIIQRVVRLLAGRGIDAHVDERKLAQSVEGDAFHEPGRDDPVGVDVVPGDVNCCAGDLGDLCE